MPHPKGTPQRFKGIYQPPSTECYHHHDLGGGGASASVGISYGDMVFLEADQIGRGFVGTWMSQEVSKIVCKWVITPIYTI